jgi:hypothetical protein
VQGLLFKYLHFYGSYDYIGDSPKWYRHEIRIVRNDKNIRSFMDAQGFRYNGKKLRVKEIDAWIYHYGWVRPPEHQQAKQKAFLKLWHSDQFTREKYGDAKSFDYSEIDSLALFKGSHPQVMKPLIESINWKFEFDPAKRNLLFKYKVTNLVEKLTGWRPGEWRNYIRI